MSPSKQHYSTFVNDSWSLVYEKLIIIVCCKTVQSLIILPIKTFKFDLVFYSTIVDSWMVVLPDKSIFDTKKCHSTVNPHPSLTCIAPNLARNLQIQFVTQK